MPRNALNHFVRIVIILAVLSLGLPHTALGQAGDPPAQPSIAYHAETGKVRFMAAQPGAALAQAPAFDAPSAAAAPEITAAAYESAARVFLNQYAAQFGIADPAGELALERARPLESGATAVRFQQVHAGIPVIGGEMIVHVNSAGQTLAAMGETLPDVSLEARPSLSAGAAAQEARQVVAAAYGLDPTQVNAAPPALWIYNPALLGAPGPRESRLVWRTEVTAPDRPDVRELALVDAAAGVILLHFNQVDAALERAIYTKNNVSGETLPGSLVRSEGEAATGDLDVDNAYDYGGATYRFYFNLYGRDSVDDKGMKLIQTVKYCDPDYTCPYANAFWNGQQMVYGQGYASGDDVVAHELTHGVTEHESGLFYYMQSGAINEAFSDIWGELVDLSYTNGRDNDSPAVRWKIGEDLPIGAIRSMSNPPAFNDPDSTYSSSYRCPAEVFTDAGDSGGVHSNSGVVNKAAYLITDGGSFRGYTIAGIGEQKAAHIFYAAQTGGLTTASDFQDLNDALSYACSALVGQYGITAANCDSVRKAAKAVGLDKQPSCEIADAPVCDTPVFNNEFTGTSLNSWDKVSGAWSESGGAAEVDGVANGYVSIARPSVFSDFSFEASFSRLGCPTCAAGLLVRGDATPVGAPASRWKSAFFFGINRSGQYRVEKWTPGGVTVLQPWTTRTENIQLNALANTLRVQSKGSALAFYVNNVLLWSGYDLFLRAADVGVAMHSDGSAGNHLSLEYTRLNGGTPLALFRDGFEDGMGRWSSSDALGGSDAWIIDPWGNAADGTKSLFAYNRARVSDYSVAMKNAVQLPAAGNAFMHFKQYHHLETNYDGGVVEYSADGGAWTDAGALFVNRGYEGQLSPNYQNPLGGRSAFTGITYGFTSSRLNLTPLLGKAVRFRFRIASDVNNEKEVDGWNVDDVQIYTCSAVNLNNFTWIPALMNK